MPRAVSHTSSGARCATPGCGKGLQSSTCKRGLCRQCCEKDPSYTCASVYHNKARAKVIGPPPSAQPPSGPESAVPASAHSVPESTSAPTHATPSRASSQSTSSVALPPTTTASSTYAQPLNTLWTHNNALGAVIQQARDEVRIGAATAKGKEREERDMVQQKTVDIQLWVQAGSRPHDISEYIAAYPVLVISSISSVLRHLPPETATLAVWNWPKGKWQEREVSSPIALQENERDVFIRIVGLMDSDCVGLPLLVQAASIVPKRPRSPASYANLALTSSPAKRVRSVNATSDLLPEASPSSFMSPPSAPDRPASCPGPLDCGPYLGLLEAPTFTSVPCMARSGQFPTKFSFAEVIRYLRRLDWFVTKEGMTQSAALAHLRGQLCVNCSDSNLGKIKMDLRAGNYDLWSRFMATSSMSDGSWAEYRVALKREATGRLTEVVWVNFPPEEIPAQDAGGLAVQMSQVALAPRSNMALSYDSSITPYDSSGDATGYDLVARPDPESHSDSVGDGVPTYGEDTSNEPPGGPTPDSSSPLSISAPSTPAYYSDLGEIPSHATQACYGSNTIISTFHGPGDMMTSANPGLGFVPYVAANDSQLIDHDSQLIDCDKSPVSIAQGLILTLLTHASDSADDQGFAPCEPVPPNATLLSHTPQFFMPCPLHDPYPCPQDCLHCIDWTSHPPPLYDASPAADSTVPDIAGDVALEAVQPDMHSLLLEVAGISDPISNMSAWSSLNGALTL